MITILVGGFLWLGARASIQQGTPRGRLHLVNAAALAATSFGLPDPALVPDLRRLSPRGTRAGQAAVIQPVGAGRPCGFRVRGVLHRRGL